MNAASRAKLGWWLGFWLGPFAGLIPFLGAADDSVARAHGRASMIYWAAALALWYPAATFVLLSGDSDIVLIVGAAAFSLASIATCTLGTIRIGQGRSLSGRPLSE